MYFSELVSCIYSNFIFDIFIKLSFTATVKVFLGYLIFRALEAGFKKKKVTCEQPLWTSSQHDCEQSLWTSFWTTLWTIITCEQSCSTLCKWAHPFPSFLLSFLFCFFVDFVVFFLLFSCVFFCFFCYLWTIMQHSLQVSPSVPIPLTVSRQKAHVREIQLFWRNHILEKSKYIWKLLFTAIASRC